MAEFWTEKKVVVCSDPAMLAESVAERFLDRVERRTTRGKTVHVALAGGVIAAAVLRALAASPRLDGVDWSLVHVWWSDERYVPAGSDERTDTAACAFLSAVGMPADNIHRVAASDSGLSIDEAADAYAAELARFADGGKAWPTFEVCFLGVGPDGHIASLFPDRPEILVTDRAVVPVLDSPKPPSERISLTRPVLNSSKRLWLVVSGTDKAAALGLALAGASYAQVPAAGAKGRKRTVFLVDEDAAAQVPLELIDQEY